MSTQNPISEMLNIIRSGQAAKKDRVNVSSSAIKIAIVKVLEKEGFIEKYLVRNNNKPILEIFLKYYRGNKPVIENIKCVSKPRLRVYKNKNSLPKVMSGMGVAIISTSKGVMTDKNARDLNVGGEVMCYVS